MSRSTCKHPRLTWVSYFSNKEDRSNANRKMRHINKQILKSYEKDVEDLCNSDFKILREISDTWDFDSDGLSRVYDEHKPIVDFSRPDYSYRTRFDYPMTSIAEARREHNWELLKHFICK